jgi:hypothetical protein
MKNASKKQGSEVRIAARRVEVRTDPGTGRRTVRAELDLKSALMMELIKTRDLVTKEDVREHINEMMEYLHGHLLEIKSISPTLDPHLYSIEYNYCAIAEGETLKDVKSITNRYMTDEFVILAINKMMGTAEQYIEHLRGREEKLKRREEQLKKKLRKGPVKVSRQLAEQMLDKRPSTRQGDLWDRLTDADKDALIEKYETPEIAIKRVNEKGEGIILSRDEERMIDCIAELLHEKSQNSKPDAPNYYMGNTPGPIGEQQIQTKDGWRTMKTAEFLVTATDIAKKFTGKDRTGAKDHSTVLKLLHALTRDDKRCTMEIKVPMINEKGKIAMTTWTSILPLWEVWKVTQDGKKGNTYGIRPHPVFYADIAKNFFFQPRTEEIKAAYGPGIQPAPLSRLIKAVGRWHSMIKTLTKGPNGTRIQEIKQIKLFEQIAPEYMQGKRIAQIKKFFPKLIETLVKLDMITGIGEREGMDGGVVYIFYLNEKWQKRGGPALPMSGSST